MIFWHLGVTTLAVRYIYRDPAMDLRWVWVGALLPDLIDKPIGAVLFNESLGAHRLFAHAIVFPVVVFFSVLVATRRGSGIRRGLIGLVIGMLFHVVLDAAWAEPEAFLWPFFGWDFPPADPSSLGPLVRHMMSQPLVWVGEAVGLAYLIYLARTRVREAGGWRRVLREGTIPLPVAR